MYLLKSDLKIETEIKKSIFITLAIKVQSVFDFAAKLTEIKQKYPGATHYVYAYKINENLKFSDAGEPNGSAGFQIYSIIKDLEITNFAIIIIRYFGGVKLGLNALTRTYKNLAVSAIKQIKKVKEETQTLLTFKFGYEAKDKVLVLISLLKPIDSRFEYKECIYGELRLEPHKDFSLLSSVSLVENLEMKTLTFYVDIN